MSGAATPNFGKGFLLARNPVRILRSEIDKPAFAAESESIFVYEYPGNNKTDTPEGNTSGLWFL